MDVCLFRHRIKIFAWGCPLFLLLLASSLSAAGPGGQKSGLVVTTLSDVQDGDVSSVAALTTSPGPDGKISLREAMQASANTAGTDFISFASGLNGAIFLTSQLPALSDTAGGAEIDGGGRITLDGSTIAGLYQPCINIVSSYNRIIGFTIVKGPDAGVYLSGPGAQYNEVSGCIIGTNAAGEAGLGNSTGITLASGANLNLIGGETAGERNVISGNTLCGILIDSAGTTVQQTAENQVTGNYIGTMPNGDAPGPCNTTGESSGIIIRDGAQNNAIGGGTAAARNVISGNCGSGVSVYGPNTWGNEIIGNYIGTDPKGATAVPNTLNGVSVSQSASQNLIGSAAVEHRNLISGNAQSGVSLMDPNTLNNYIYNNYIGVNAAGDAALPNGQCGVVITDGAIYNFVGNTTAFGNLISGNTEDGVRVSGAATLGNVIHANSIHHNGGKGIALINGANDNIAPPIVTMLTLNQVEVAGFPNSVVEFYIDDEDEGQTLVTTYGIGPDQNTIVFYSDFSSQIGKYLTTTITDSKGTSEFSEPYQITSLVEGETEGQICQDYSACVAGCPGSYPDNDGDGVNACVEECMCTSDDTPDSDADGMPDGYEVQHDFDPTANEADGDADLDGLTNIEEYRLGTDPKDANSPGGVFYVAPAPQGLDAADRGTRALPWASIGYAMAHAVTSPATPLHIVALAGTYTESVALAPGMTLSGDPGESVQIIGSLAGASNSTVEGLDILADGTGAFCLSMNDVVMRLTRVRFLGTEDRTETGLLVTGNAPAESVVEQCTFNTLGVGIDIADDIPMIRRCVFANIAGAGIVVRQGTAGVTTNSLGGQDDPNRGCNTFGLDIDGPAVQNERSTPLLLENNDWGSTDPQTIAGRIAGTGGEDFSPFLAAGSGVLAASLYCTVWDAGSQARIINGSIQAGNFGPVTHNLEGVYAFPALPSGTYAIEASAPSYENAQQTTVVGSGQQNSALFALHAKGGEEGEGEGEGETPVSCHCSNSEKTLPAKSDLFLGALTVLTLMLHSRPRRGAK